MFVIQGNSSNKSTHLEYFQKITLNEISHQIKNNKHRINTHDDIVIKEDDIRNTNPFYIYNANNENNIKQFESQIEHNDHHKQHLSQVYNNSPPNMKHQGPDKYKPRTESNNDPNNVYLHIDTKVIQTKSPSVHDQYHDNTHIHIHNNNGKLNQKDFEGQGYL